MPYFETLDLVCYMCATLNNHYMKTKSLIDTNPYLRDASMRRGLVARSVRTSCGVEGICAKKGGEISFNIPTRKDKKIYKSAN